MAGCEGTSSSELVFLNELRNLVKEGKKINHNILLASEGFSNLDVECGIPSLHNELAGFNVTIVMHYRDWISRLISDHSQSNKHLNSSISLPDFIPRWFDRSNAIATDLVQAWASVFGKSNIIAVDYNGAAAAHVDLFELFIRDILKVPVRLKENSKPKNVSPVTKFVH